MRIGDNLYCINDKIVIVSSFNKEVARKITHKKGKVYKIKGYLLGNDIDVINRFVEHGQVPYEAISIYIEAEPTTTPNGYYGFTKDINKISDNIFLTNYREHFITENQYRKLKLKKIRKDLVD